jgi:hypothetical protein
VHADGGERHTAAHDGTADDNASASTEAVGDIRYQWNGQEAADAEDGRQEAESGGAGVVVCYSHVVRLPFLCSILELDRENILSSHAVMACRPFMREPS